MSDEEPVNPKLVAEEQCKPQCPAQWKEYEKCVARIEGKPGKHCQGYYLEFWHCVDKCALPIYWKELKK